MILLEYIKFYINKTKHYVRNYILNCKCDKLNIEIDALKEQLISLEKTTKPKHTNKNGKIEIENGI